jgi:hypothetical protein
VRFLRVISQLIKVLASGNNRYPKDFLEKLLAQDDVRRGVAKCDGITMRMTNFFAQIQDDRACQCIQLKKMINTQYYNMLLFLYFIPLSTGASILTMH